MDNPKISHNTYKEWYYKMLLLRRFEDKAGSLYGIQKIRGFCHLYSGQEACIVGAVSALNPNDKYITAYRDHAHPIALGTNPKYIMAELFGKQAGISKGKGGSMHMFDKEKNFFGGHGIVGAQIPIGVGIAFAEKYKETSNICITYMGDGAVRQGAFHESLNLAMLYKLPVLFLIENNGYAMGTSVKRSSNVTNLHKLGLAYDMPSEQVNAMSIEDVYYAIQKASLRVRNENIPTLLELKTYRYKGHSISDPGNYRNKDEINLYKEKDPIENLKYKLLDKKIATSDFFIETANRVQREIEEAVEFADTAPFPDISEVYKDIYAQDDYPFLKN